MENISSSDGIFYPPQSINREKLIKVINKVRLKQQPKKYIKEVLHFRENQGGSKNNS